MREAVMGKVLNCYYLDEPLTPEERKFAEETLIGANSYYATGATSLVEKRVPNLLPVLDENSSFSDDVTARIQLVKKNLRKAGIRSDGGKQVVFVMPKDIGWSGVFQMAIHEETGFSPYAIQRWYYDEDEPERRDPRILDVHGMIGGKE